MAHRRARAFTAMDRASDARSGGACRLARALRSLRSAAQRGQAATLFVTAFIRSRSLDLPTMPTLPPFARSFVAVMAGMVVAVTLVSIFDLLGWVLGAFAGGLVASRVAARSRRQYSWVIAGVSLAATIANLRAIPHPAWMVVGALFGVPAAGWCAARFAPPDDA